MILDAIESVKIPGGFQLRFKVDRNPDRTRLAESEFDKHCDHLGLWGISQRPLDFDLDTRNFLLSVNLYTVSESKPRHPTPSSIRPGKPTDPTDPSSSDLIADRFLSLECYSAAEFEEVVRLKFVPRMRVIAGSTGGKSPLLELIGSAIAQIYKGELWLINPIPGSEKDWFHVPGVISSGTDGITGAIQWLVKAHSEFKTRRNDLPGTANKPFITVMVDEINAIARDFPDLGTVMKDFYQLSDHTRMGFLTAGQGGNVSGVSGGSQELAKKAEKLLDQEKQFFSLLDLIRDNFEIFSKIAAKHGYRGLVELFKEEGLETTEGTLRGYFRKIKLERGETATKNKGRSRKKCSQKIQSKSVQEIQPEPVQEIQSELIQEIQPEPAQEIQSEELPKSTHRGRIKLAY